MQIVAPKEQQSMKLRCAVHFVLMVLLVFSGASLAHAQTGDVAKDVVRVEIPFDFYVGNHRMEAGTYYVSLNPATQRVDLCSANSTERVYVIGALAGDEQRDLPARLEFDHIANDYFLKEIKTPETSVGLSVNKFEEQIAGSSVTTVSVTRVSH
jgi:hypothetical protein